MHSDFFELPVYFTGNHSLDDFVIISSVVSRQRRMQFKTGITSRNGPGTTKEKCCKVLVAGTFANSVLKLQKQDEKLLSSFATSYYLHAEHESRLNDRLAMGPR